jgi:probable H4MPT-linked C1 transfer pathway protein
MTAELADCFATKQEGVEFVLRGVEEAAGELPVGIWMTSGRFAGPSEAGAAWMQVAAANWHALAAWSGRFAREGTALLVDIGSTTTDLIPLRDGIPEPAGLTDVDRLLSRELVYTGVRRTPLCAVAQEVPLRGRTCPLAAEWFATMLDVYLLLGSIPEDPTSLSTANGRPATISCAQDRLARSLCCDRTELSSDELQSIAEFLANRQSEQLIAALEQALSRSNRPVRTVVVSGEGEFLARHVLQRHPATCDAHRISLSGKLSPAAATSAAAFAVAILAAESTVKMGKFAQVWQSGRRY